MFTVTRETRGQTQGRFLYAGANWTPKQIPPTAPWNHSTVFIPRPVILPFFFSSISFCVCVLYIPFVDFHHWVLRSVFDVWLEQIAQLAARVITKTCAKVGPNCYNSLVGHSLWLKRWLCKFSRDDRQRSTGPSIIQTWCVIANYSVYIFIDPPALYWGSF